MKEIIWFDNLKQLLFPELETHEYVHMIEEITQLYGKGIVERLQVLG